MFWKSLQKPQLARGHHLLSSGHASTVALIDNYAIVPGGRVVTAPKTYAALAGNGPLELTQAQLFDFRSNARLILYYMNDVGRTLSLTLSGLTVLGREETRGRTVTFSKFGSVGASLYRLVVVTLTKWGYINLLIKLESNTQLGILPHQHRADHHHTNNRLTGAQLIATKVVVERELEAIVIAAQAITGPPPAAPEPLPRPRSQ